MTEEFKKGKISCPERRGVAHLARCRDCRPHRGWVCTVVGTVLQARFLPQVPPLPSSHRICGRRERPAEMVRSYAG
jgi:hypothetical protein